MRPEEEQFIIMGKIIASEISGNTLTEAERNLLNHWISLSNNNLQLYERCKDMNEQHQVYQYLQQLDATSSYLSIKNKLFTNTKNDSKKYSVLSIRTYIAAAILLIVSSFATYFLYSYFDRDSKDINQELANKYTPASNKATVTLSDGRVFELDAKHKELFIDDSNLNYGNGQHIAETSRSLNIKVSTPKGGIYNVTLPDGTRVKLNADSELDYPTQFNESKREVNLIGEAYFEVVSNNEQPFIVKSKDQIITVLGTHFNIAAYNDNFPSRTTLTEGKVSVRATNKDNSITLAPGQQAVLANGILTKNSVDVTQELGWLNGKFNFDGKSLSEVMNEVSRWYDLDVIYKGTIPEIEFFGGMFRNSKLTTILSLLESNHLTYRLTEDKQLIISSTK